MAYNITLTDGTNLVTVADGTIVTDYTSLTLVGKNFAGYGSFLNENFVKLIENFANSTEPPYPLQGQIWWDTTNKVLKVRSGGIWKTVSSSSASATGPVSPTIGDLWWDTVNGQLNVWSGSQWVVVGPSYTSLQKRTGAIAESVTEAGGSGVKHIVVKFYVNDVLTAILSKDPSFTVTGLTGFNIINPGFTLSSLGNLGYYGDANNALNLAGIAANKYLRSDIVSTTDFRLNVKTDDGLNVGFNNDFSVKSSTTDVDLLSNLEGKNLNIYAKVGPASQKMMTFHANADAAFGGITVSADPTQPLGVATKQYVDAQMGSGGPANLTSITTNILPSVDLAYTIGSSTSRWTDVWATTFHGNATTANYADLAERFAADAAYTPGTVVELGGSAEVTAVVAALSETVFGVVSTAPAYLMNTAAGDNSTHPPIALNGRVPVKVIGVVSKGDRLVSAGNGLARTGLLSEITPFNVIGRSLVAKDTLGEGMVEAIVKINT